MIEVLTAVYVGAASLSIPALLFAWRPEPVPYNVERGS